MRDRYIDYGEISEYGKHFLDAILSLVGTSDLVDVAKLHTLVSNTVTSVETELQKATGDRSELRTEREGTVDATIAVRDTLTRFYYHLRSLPSTANVDFDAFYPGQTMGDLGHLKPADLEGKAADVLRGFNTPQNKTITAFADWKTEIESGRQTLSNAISGKGNASGIAFVATAALIDARKNFLHAYTNVAKPIVRGLLAQLGREHELRLFFKDLTVNEGGNTPPPAAP